MLPHIVARGGGKGLSSRENGLLPFGVVWHQSQTAERGGVALVPNQGELGCMAVGLVGLDRAFCM